MATNGLRTFYKGYVLFPHGELFHDIWNTTIRKRGSQPWRDMMTLWFEDTATFLKRYCQRSKAESVYSALKRCYGKHLSSHKRTAQRRELHLKTLTYNIGRVNLTNINEESR